MGENSAISWTQHTWNPWLGCTKISPACDGCYAEAMLDHRYGKVKWGGERVRTVPNTWAQPFRWQKKAAKDGTRPFVFCASLADIFDNQVNPQWRADAFDVMRQTPNLVYLLLTKRPQNIVKLSDAAGGLPQNAALGTTVEDQTRAAINLPALQVAKIELQPLFTFGSFEPLLGRVFIPPAFMPDWIITGGETDQGSHKARPTHPEWFRFLRDQAKAAGVPYHHKQNGEWVPVPKDQYEYPWPIDGEKHCRLTVGGPKHGSGRPMLKVGKKLAGRMLDGVTHDEFPILKGD